MNTQKLVIDLIASGATGVKFLHVGDVLNLNDYFVRRSEDRGERVLTWDGCTITVDDEARYMLLRPTNAQDNWHDFRGEAPKATDAPHGGKLLFRFDDSGMGIYNWNYFSNGATGVTHWRTLPPPPVVVELSVRVMSGDDKPKPYILTPSKDGSVSVAGRGGSTTVLSNSIERIIALKAGEEEAPCPWLSFGKIHPFPSDYQPTDQIEVINPEGKMNIIASAGQIPTDSVSWRKIDLSGQPVMIQLTGLGWEPVKLSDANELVIGCTTVPDETWNKLLALREKVMKG